MIVGCDPSSKATAIAGLHEHQLLGYTLIKPKRDQTAIEKAEQVYQESVAYLTKVIETYQIPEFAVIEVSNGHLHRRVREETGGASVGMTTYGMAIFAVARACLSLGIPVVEIQATKWAGGKSKAARAAAIAMKHPGYVSTDDPGLDIADAIGVAEYFEKRRLLNGGVHVPDRRTRKDGRGSGASSRRGWAAARKVKTAGAAGV